MGPTWGPPGSWRPWMGPMLTPCTLLSWIWLHPSTCRHGFDEYQSTHGTSSKSVHPLPWCHNGCDGVSNHLPHDYLLNCYSRRRLKKTSKLRATGLCAGNSAMTGEFPVQGQVTRKNVSIWWRHHAFENYCKLHCPCTEMSSLSLQMS